VLGRRQRSTRPQQHQQQACAATHAVPMALCPGQLSMLARPLAEHDEFGRFRVRRNGYELDVARGRILSMGDDNGPHDGHTGSNSSLNSESTATSSEYRYRVPKSAIERSQPRRKPRSASSSMRLAVACQAPKRMRKLGAGQISTLRRRRRSEGGMKGSNDHVSHPDYRPNLDHLE
jgi:hypothetical protein